MTSSDLMLLGRLRYDLNSGDIYPRYKYTRCVVVGRPLGSKSGRYIEIRVGGDKYYAHRLAWFLHYKAWPKGQIDHKNGDKHDNRIVNLRDVDSLTQSKNKSKFKNNTSGFSGVSYCKNRDKWRAYGFIGNRYKHLGWYKSFDEAVNARSDFNGKSGYTERHGK